MKQATLGESRLEINYSKITLSSNTISIAYYFILVKPSQVSWTGRPDDLILLKVIQKFGEGKSPTEKPHLSGMRFYKGYFLKSFRFFRLGLLFFLFNNWLFCWRFSWFFFYFLFFFGFFFDLLFLCRLFLYRFLFF